MPTVVPCRRRKTFHRMPRIRPAKVNCRNFGSSEADSPDLHNRCDIVQLSFAQDPQSVFQEWSAWNSYQLPCWQMCLSFQSRRSFCKSQMLFPTRVVFHNAVAILYNTGVILASWCSALMETCASVLIKGIAWLPLHFLSFLSNTLSVLLT